MRHTAIQDETLCADGARIGIENLPVRFALTDIEGDDPLAIVARAPAERNPARASTPLAMFFWTDKLPSKRVAERLRAGVEVYGVTVAPTATHTPAPPTNTPVPPTNTPIPPSTSSAMALSCMTITG